MQLVTIEPSCRTHTKVYSGECLEAGGKRTWYWICSGCLGVGSDDLDAGFKPKTDPRAYWKLSRQKNPRCWVPQTFR